MAGIGYVRINKQTSIAYIKQTLSNNEVYFMLNKALK
jgi:L-arabinose isomerase